jgi:WD40 repeat protein
VPAIYTPSTKELDLQQHRAGQDFGDWNTDASWCWLPDGRRILTWDTSRGVATLWDTVTQEVRDVPGIPGPSDIALSADGRTLVLDRVILEGDIWMLTLD